MSCDVSSSTAQRSLVETSAPRLQQQQTENLQSSLSPQILGQKQQCGCQREPDQVRERRVAEDKSTHERRRAASLFTYGTSPRENPEVEMETADWVQGLGSSGASHKALTIWSDQWASLDQAPGDQGNLAEVEMWKWVVTISWDLREERRTKSCFTAVRNKRRTRARVPSRCLGFMNSWNIL